MERRRIIISLIFCLVFFISGYEVNAYQTKIHPEDVETYEFSLTFPLDFPSQKVLSTASKSILDRALQSIGLSPVKDLDPEDFVQRISIKRRELKPDGIEYTFASSLNMKKLIFFVSTGEKMYSVNVSNCSFVSPIITRVLLEYTVSADVSCYITYIEEISGISTLKLDLSGSLGSKSKSRFRFKKTYYFFSFMPYEQIYADFLSYFESLGYKKIFKVFEQTFELDSYKKVIALLDSLSTKSYFYFVIPFEVLKKDDNSYILKVLLFAFSIIKDEDISDLIQKEIRKFGKSTSE